MGLPAPSRGEVWGSSALPGLTSFTFSVGPDATCSAVAASMLGHPTLGSRGRFSQLVVREGLSTCSSASPGVPATGLCNGAGLSPTQLLPAKELKQGLGEDRGIRQQPRIATGGGLRWPCYLGSEMTSLTQHQGGS